jgi:hypothetical protein
MDFYVTFGSQYAHEPHPTFRDGHPDGYLVVEADDVRAAHAAATVFLGHRWSRLYQEPPAPVYAPYGEVGRLVDGVYTPTPPPHQVRYLGPGVPCEVGSETSEFLVDDEVLTVERWWTRDSSETEVYRGTTPAGISPFVDADGEEVWLPDLTDQEQKLYQQTWDRVARHLGLPDLIEQVRQETERRYRFAPRPWMDGLHAAETADAR